MKEQPSTVHLRSIAGGLLTTCQLGGCCPALCSEAVLSSPDPAKHLPVRRVSSCFHSRPDPGILRPQEGVCVQLITQSAWHCCLTLAHGSTTQASAAFISRPWTLNPITTIVSMAGAACIETDSRSCSFNQTFCQTGRPAAPPAWHGSQTRPLSPSCVLHQWLPSSSAAPRYSGQRSLQSVRCFACIRARSTPACHAAAATALRVSSTSSWGHPQTDARSPAQTACHLDSTITQARITQLPHIKRRCERQSGKHSVSRLQTYPAQFRSNNRISMTPRPWCSTCSKHSVVSLWPLAIPKMENSWVSPGKSALASGNQ